MKFRTLETEEERRNVVFDRISRIGVFVAGKRAKPVIMFGVDSLSTQGRIRILRVRQTGVMYPSRDRTTHGQQDEQAVKINRDHPSW